MHLFVSSVIFALALSSVKPDICPDHSSCPGDETCCAASSEYRCCPLVGGTCCADGLYCCPLLFTCIPWLDICLPSPPKKAQPNSVTRKSLLPTTKTMSARMGQCSSGTTWCAGGPPGESCCPLPDSVCCSDQMHCCPKGYTCDVNEKTCVENSHPSSSHRLASVTKLKFVHCPDKKICPDGATCCLKASGGYGCCPYPDGVCCLDKIHCCPSGTSCDISKKRCSRGKEVIPWLKKIPVINVDRFNNSKLN